MEKQLGTQNLEHASCIQPYWHRLRCQQDRSSFIFEKYSNILMQWCNPTETFHVLASNISMVTRIWRSLSKWNWEPLSRSPSDAKLLLNWSSMDARGEWPTNWTETMNLCLITTTPCNCTGTKFTMTTFVSKMKKPRENKKDKLLSPMLWKMPSPLNWLPKVENCPRAKRSASSTWLKFTIESPTTGVNTKETRTKSEALMESSLTTWTREDPSLKLIMKSIPIDELCIRILILPIHLYQNNRHIIIPFIVRFENYQLYLNRVMIEKYEFRKILSQWIFYCCRVHFFTPSRRNPYLLPIGKYFVFMLEKPLIPLIPLFLLWRSPLLFYRLFFPL